MNADVTLIYADLRWFFFLHVAVTNDWSVFLLNTLYFLLPKNYICSLFKSNIDTHEILHYDNFINNPFFFIKLLENAANRCLRK